MRENLVIHMDTNYSVYEVTQYFILIFKCYMFRSKMIIMRRSSTRKYATIDLHVTLANITVLFENNNKVIC